MSNTTRLFNRVEILSAFGPPFSMDPRGSRDNISRRFRSASLVMLPKRSLPASFEIIWLRAWTDFVPHLDLANSNTDSRKSFSMAGESSDDTPLSFMSSFRIANVACASISLESISVSNRSITKEASFPGLSMRMSESHPARSAYSDPLISNTHQGTSVFKLNSSINFFTRFVLPVPVAPRTATCSLSHSDLIPISLMRRPP